MLRSIRGNSRVFTVFTGVHGSMNVRAYVLNLPCTRAGRGRWTVGSCQCDSRPVLECLRPSIRGLHSSASQLNLSALCGLHASTFRLDVSTFRGLCGEFSVPKRFKLSEDVDE